MYTCTYKKWSQICTLFCITKKEVFVTRVSKYFQNRYTGLTRRHDKIIYRLFVIMYHTFYYIASKIDKLGYYLTLSTYSWGMSRVWVWNCWGWSSQGNCTSIPNRLLSLSRLTKHDLWQINTENSDAFNAIAFLFHYVILHQDLHPRSENPCENLSLSF